MFKLVFSGFRVLGSRVEGLGMGFKLTGNLGCGS